MYNITSYADGNQIKIAGNLLKRNIIFFCIGLYQLKTYPASRKFLIRIFAVASFGVEHGNSIWQFFTRKVMIAYNKIDSFGIGVSNFINRFDAAVERYNQT